ncbi:hypothetical protein ACM55H_16760 [Flavobacterium sp. ZT3R17]|uniref:hypothetical protein n=1 Tax=Flavobacterium cryoconiti TaxID=3398736 RepID=UPI003A8857DB
MNTKITFHLLDFFKFMSNLSSRFDGLVCWNNLSKIESFTSLIDIYFNQIINFLSAFTINISSNLIMNECSLRTIHPSICKQHSKMNFAIYKHFIF